MSRPRFLADHDLNEQIVDGLLRREPAIDIIRVREVGLRERPDDEVLKYAADQRLLVVSHDVNTMTAAAYARIEAGEPMPGLLMVRQTEPIAPIIESVLLIWTASEMEEWDGQVWFLPV
jgi:predicted nuclease of predicted toxin-antitoxin system